MTHTTATLIDHVLDNLVDETKACGVITTQLQGNSGYTDHYPIYTLVQHGLLRTQNATPITRRKINACTKRVFSERLQDTDLSNVYHNDPNQASSNLMTTLQELHDDCFPIVTG